MDASIETKMGETSFTIVGRICSDEPRLGVRSHSRAAPQIAQLRVDAIISG